MKTQPKIQLEFKVDFDSSRNFLRVTHTCGANARREHTIRVVLDMHNKQEQLLFMAACENAENQRFSEALKAAMIKIKLGMLSLDNSQIPAGSFLAISHAIVDYARSIRHQWEKLAAA